MSPLLAPVEKPSHPMLKLGYAFTRKQFGTVPGPLSVFCARMPFAFTSFYSKVGKLDKKLTLPGGLALLLRQQVARINVCEFCIEGSRYAAIRNRRPMRQSSTRWPTTTRVRCSQTPSGRRWTTSVG